MRYRIMYRGVPLIVDGECHRVDGQVFVLPYRIQVICRPVGARGHDITPLVSSDQREEIGRILSRYAIEEAEYKRALGRPVAYEGA